MIEAGIGHCAMQSPSICARPVGCVALRNKSFSFPGIQQALDLLAQVLLLKKGDPIWMEDPGYFGARIAFDNVGARIVAVTANDEGLSVSAGVKICPNAKGAYVTPAHQFRWGQRCLLERRMAPSYLGLRCRCFCDRR